MTKQTWHDDMTWYDSIYLFVHTLNFTPGSFRLFTPGSVSFSPNLLTRNANFSKAERFQPSERRKAEISPAETTKQTRHEKIEQTSVVCALQHLFIDLLEKIVDDSYCKDPYLE